MKDLRFLAVVIGALGVASAFAVELGDPAPPLSIKSWVKGGPVDLAKGKGTNIFVVEFWATWCGPCKVSIPHLTETQRKFKDKGVVVIGVTAEKEADAKVPPFVTKQGEKMDYIVAIDADNATNKAYIEAFGIPGIPHAFIIDKEGKLVWHGHPMEQLDEVIQAVIDGKHDMSKAKEADARMRKMMAVNQVFEKYIEMVSTTKGNAEAKVLAKQLLDALNDSAQGLNQIAWIVLDNKGIIDRDYEFAMAAAARANELTKGEDPAILDTLARANFDTGKVKEALELQEKAVSLCKDDPLCDQLKEVLAKYKAAAEKK